MLVSCDNCDGTGQEEWEAEWCAIGEFVYRKCMLCNGTGSIRMSLDEFEEMKEREHESDDY